MNLLEVSAAIAIILAFYCLGWVFVFVSRILLGRKRNKFSCQQCGNCCRLRFIPILQSDIDRMASAGHKDFYEKKGREFAMKRKKGRCMFLKNDSCSIYLVRPDVCREFPFFKQWGIPYCRAVSYCPAIEAMLKDA
jgi:Fe-S-cluster containining protein